MNEDHEHTWIPDGESWQETDHHDSCKFPVVKKLESCQCKTYRVRRFTCHCGEMKEVRYE